MNKQYKISFIIWTLVLVILPFVINNAYLKHLAIMSLIFAIMAQGLNLILGYCGNLSLGQAALYAMGGYIYSLLAKNLGVNFWLALLAAVILVAFTGYLVGLISLRVRGSAFIVMTISFSSIIHLVLLNWVNLTNGQMGIANIPAPSMMGYVFDTKMGFYYFVLVFLVIIQLISGRIVRSKLGRAFVAVKDDELLASSVGISAYHYSLFAFVLGAAFTGLSGVLYASYSQFISPEMSNFNLVMLPLLMMTVLGGRQTIWGPVLGAFIFTVLPEYLRIIEDLRLPIFGFLLILMVLFLPDGLLPSFKKFYGRFKKTSTAEEGIR
jgi:branched-chain amino acid transport system permease protein